MLQRVLAAIAMSEGAITVQSLARTLGVPEPLVAEMVVHLETLGYLKSSETCTSQDGCSSCGLREACKTRGWRLWELTEKGLHLTRRPG